MSEARLREQTVRESQRERRSERRSDQRVQVVLPVKGLDHAKSRLDQVLDDEQRRALAGMLLDDTLRVLAHTPSLGRLFVVTGHPEVSRRARKAGATVVDEPRASRRSRAKNAPPPDPLAPLNTAVEAGREAALAKRREAPILSLPVDLPLLSGVNLETVLQRVLTPLTPLGLNGNGQEGKEPVGRVTLQTDDAEDGTNFLLLEPADAIRYRYGPKSYFAHQQEARSLGFEVVRLDEPGLRWDLDTPDVPQRLLDAMLDDRALTTCFLRALQRSTALPFLLSTPWGKPLVDYAAAMTANSLA